MSVDQLPKPSAATRGDTKLVHYDEYIDRQVESTRRVVKIVDLATSLVVLAAGVLAFLLVAAVVEHWIVPGGFPVLLRFALFALLAGSVGYFAFRRLWPLVISRVNPVYAAHTIEVSASTGPSLKNSLVNLLLFRQKRSEISDAVYHTLEEQAAVRLSRVPLDAAVDRSLLIKFGYALVAIVAVAALYKVFSPKDPVVAAQRVLMPWADIVPASRVSIADVKPGVVTVARGEFIDVSAEVRGIGDEDTVLLRYTTADGQAVDKSLPMKLSRGNLRFEGRLPNEKNGSGESGLAQNITYRIEAGDARTLDYAVKVVEAPSILVERIEYDYPEYTGYVDRQVEELGDIRAIEGTRITVHARANGAIKEAHVDFDADGRREVVMKASHAKASASFLLALRDDRRTPEHASYVLRFANEEGRPNHSPVKHSIYVEADYSPEAAIVTPREKSRDVRLDETIAIEATASDPDFELSDVRLRGRVLDRDVVNEPLLKPGHKGRLAARYQFTPSMHGLKAGDVVQYWVAANDNRTPTPNSAESQKQQFRIVSPDPAQQPPPDRIAQRDPPKQGQRGKGQPQQGEQQPQDGADGKGDQQGEAQQGGAGEQGRPGENQQPQQGQEGQGGEQGQKGQSKDGAGVSRDAQRSADPGDSPQNGGEGAPARGEQGPGENQSEEQGGQAGKQPQPGEQTSNGKQTGAGAAGSEPSQGAQPAGTRQPAEPGAGSARPDGDNRAQPANGKQQSGEQQDGDQPLPQNAEPSAVSADGDNDGEAFDRIQQHMQRKGEMKDGELPAEQNAAERGGEGETGRQGDSTAEGSEKKDAAAQEKSADERNVDDDEQSDKKADERGEGTGADTKGGEPQSAQAPKEQTGEKGEQTKSPGGQETSTKGESGAGDEQQAQGSPNSQPEMKPTEKREQSPSQDEQSNQQEPPAGGRGKKESDSQGEQGGDRSGGGEEGGGQKAPRDGTGSAGQNQSANEGAGESSEQGTGNNSPNAGQDAVADKETGQTGGETKGRGSKTREAPGGEEEVGKKDGGEGERGEKDPLHREVPREERQGEGEKGRGGEKDDARKDGADQKSGDPQDGGEDGKQNADDSANQNGAPTGSGGVKGTTLAPPRNVGTAPEGADEANLEYARKQTDLVLDKLSDQLNQKQVDKDLLKQLGWSEDDLRKFVARWKERKEAAERNDPSADAAKRELDEALRSLGLRRGPLKQGTVKDDTMQDLREGFRGPVPLEYQERLRAYNQGVSRARPDGE